MAPRAHPSELGTEHSARHGGRGGRGRTAGPVVGIVGVGYMGIATGLAFAHRGRSVVAYDIDRGVRAALRKGRSPYREPGLAELLGRESRRDRFHIVDSLSELARRAECIFLCVSTPPGPGGRVDLRPIRSASRALGAALREVRGFRTVVVKSTVVPGTTDEVIAPILRRTSGRSARTLGVAVNPEFLSEGRMVRDAIHPARIVLGASGARAARAVRRAYAGFSAPIVALSPTEAELVKHGSNAFLALKVSYANELSRWTERLGGDVDRVAEAVGADPRIGPEFLRAGPGFGGSCFDKDLRAFRRRAQELGLGSRIADAALGINDDQTRHAVELVQRAGGPLRGREVAVLGLAFKAGTDDVRESRAFPIVEALLAAGARVRVHDPSALANFRREWARRSPRRSARLRFVRTAEAAVTGADLAVLQTDWPEYLRWPSAWSRRMRRPRLVDLRRRVPAPVARRAGLEVFALGRGASGPTPAPRGRRRRA